MGRLRLHVNPLTAASLLPREPLAIPEGPALEVELGCGDGLFLIQRAERFPDRLFVGIDIRPEFFAKGLDALRARRLENCRLEPANLIVDLAHLFPAERVSAFWINFPDPWFKRRQHNRRWLDTEGVQHLVNALTPGGTIYYQSDVWAPAVEALALLEANHALRNWQGEFSFHHEPLVSEMTSRETACKRQQRKIWRLRFVRDR